jgi:hypothetical protein
MAAPRSFGETSVPPGAGAAGARPARPLPTGARTVNIANGSVVLRANGRPLEVQDVRTGMRIHHNLTGSQRVVVENRDGSRVAFERGRPGYVSRSYLAHGYAFDRRTYYDHGRAVDRFYRPYRFHGVGLEVYVPGRYYPASYYRWVYRPWPFPVHYGWRFRSAPWYGFYGAYFVPYPVYYSPSLWLTDYLFAESLDEMYAQQEADGYAAGYSGAPISPEVKQLVANEVEGELALEDEEANAEGQMQAPDPAYSSIAGVLSDGKAHVFVAGREVDVVDSSGRECAVTEGDVVEVTVAPGAEDTAATAQVLSSKGGQDCPVRDSVAIPLDELEEMQNHMRATLDRGMAQLQTEQGRDGLPPAPADALAAPAPGLELQGAPPADPEGAQEIATQTQLAQTADQQLTAAATTPPGAPPTVSLSLGQSFADVTAVLGQPAQVIRLGQKTIYVYPATKVTFVNGQVSDIQ